MGWILLPVGVISPGDKRPGTECGRRRALSCNTPKERLGGLPGLELLKKQTKKDQVKNVHILQIQLLTTFAS